MTEVLANNVWWLREAAKVFQAAGCGNMSEDCAHDLAAELDDAGLSEVWRGEAGDAARRQISEWNQWARKTR